MLLHIGGGVSVPLDHLICILNGTGMTEDTKGYIQRARQARRFKKCAGKAKCFLLVRERGKEYVYASPIAAATLEKRWKDEIDHAWLRECAVLTILEEE